MAWKCVPSWDAFPALFPDIIICPKLGRIKRRNLMPENRKIEKAPPHKTIDTEEEIVI